MLVRYEKDNTNKTMGTLCYFYMSGNKRKSIKVSVGYPAVTDIYTIQDLINMAFIELYKRIGDIKE